MTASTTQDTAALTFTTPPPGLAPIVDFALTPVDGAVGLYTLRAAEADVRLFLVDPAFFVPEYAPLIPSDHVEALGAATAADVGVLVVAHLQDGAPVVNLLAPILVNLEGGTAVQIILDEDQPLAAPLTLTA